MGSRWSWHNSVRVAMLESLTMTFSHTPYRVTSSALAMALAWLPPCLTDLLHFMLLRLCLKLTQWSSFHRALLVSFSGSSSLSPTNHLHFQVVFSIFSPISAPPPFSPCILPLLPFTSHCISLPLAFLPVLSHPLNKSSCHLCADAFQVFTFGFSCASEFEFGLLIRLFYLVFPGNYKAMFRIKLILER